MSIPVFYTTQNTSFNQLTLSEDTSKHVVQVLRMAAGEQLRLTDGKGNILIAEIADPHKKACVVNIKERGHVEQTKKSVCVAISLLKNTARFEWFLEKATEIGVQEITVLRCDRTEKQHFRWERMNNILVAAMLQSQQCWLPRLTEPTLFHEVIDSSTYPLRLIAHCEVQSKQNLSDVSKSGSAQIFIGPEGDFTSEEIRYALKKGCHPVNLGNTRLRTETAGVVAATLLCI